MDQPGAIGIVAEPMAAAPSQSVARACGSSACALLGRQRKRIELEGRGYVETHASLGRKSFGRGGKAIERRKQALVAHRLAGRSRERGVYQRRFTVRNGIADDGVAVGHDRRIGLHASMMEATRIIARRADRRTLFTERRRSRYCPPRPPPPAAKYRPPSCRSHAATRNSPSIPVLRTGALAGGSRRY